MSETRKRSRGCYLEPFLPEICASQCFSCFPWWAPRYLKALRAAALNPQEKSLLETPPVKKSAPVLETPAKTLRKAFFQEVAAKQEVAAAQSATACPTPNQLVAAPESQNSHDLVAGFNISLESIVAFQRSADALGKGPSYAKKHETFVSTMAFESWTFLIKYKNEFYWLVSTCFSFSRLLVPENQSQID